MSIVRGWLGEKMTTFGMWLSLDASIYRRFHNVIVPTANGTTQIDHLLVSPFGLFVIETKNIKGWIFGSEHQPKWTQMPPNVVNTGLRSYIHSYRDRFLSDGDIETVVGAIERLKGDGSLTHAVHMRSLCERRSSTTVCPKCGPGLTARLRRAFGNRMMKGERHGGLLIS